MGATAVVVSEGEDIAERVKALTNGEGVKYAIDAVGGETASACVRALGRDGRLVLYSSLSGEPLRFDPRAVMVGNKRIEGFWLSEWARDQSVFRMLGLFRQIKALLREGIATTDVGATHPLDAIHEAVRQADTPGRKGKVLLRIGSR
jgi:NADPH:quinone reductase-like Zn-dependent oxidoreductase